MQLQSVSGSSLLTQIRPSFGRVTSFLVFLFPSLPASKAQVLFLFDQMIYLDLEFLFTKGRERGSGVLLDVPNHHLGLPAFASDRDSKCALMRQGKT